MSALLYWNLPKCLFVTNIYSRGHLQPDKPFYFCVACKAIIIELLQTLTEFTNTAHRNCWYLPSALQVNKSIVQIINSPFYSHLTRRMFTWQRMESRLLLARGDVWFIGFFATVYFQCLHSSWHESFWTNDHDCRSARNPFHCLCSQ